MKIALERSQVQALAEAFPRLGMLQDQLKFSHRLEIPWQQLQLKELAFLGDLYSRQGSVGRHHQLQGLLAALQDEGPRFGPEDDLEQLLPVLAHYLMQDARRGWLFATNAQGRPAAWVVTRLDYVSASNEEMGKVMIEMKALLRAGIASWTVRITGPDLQGHTVPEILAAKGLLKETSALLAAYDDMAARYIEWRARYGAQFCGQGTGFVAEDPSATHRDADWTRKDQVVLSASGGPARLVNDESILPPRTTTLDTTGDILGTYLRKAAKSNRYVAEDEVQAERASQPAGLFTQLPVQGFLFMFHLELHQHLWVHVDELQPYAYQPDLKTKLVLPPEQTDLIDILTAEMDVLMDDIVAGKSGGTTVLCAGPPGRGKDAHR